MYLGTMLQQMRQISYVTDMIGWTHFTDGRLYLPLKILQEHYLSHCYTYLTVDSCMRAFIGKILELTHSQWIFQNITKHHHTNGTIKLKAQRDVLKEIERQLNLGITALPP